ncbi:MAG TPA: [protein-PII] uridylyltransferase [Sutterella sp.]|nr:[protein-PII] uridylyltransferase [Sutterella sp.]
MDTNAQAFLSHALNSAIQSFGERRSSALSRETLMKASREAILQIAEKHLQGVPVALFATGGLARGELFPFSDLDILLLTQESPNDATLAAVKAFMNEIWVLGPEIGHSVRSVSQAIHQADKDITVLTSLFDRVFYFGSEALKEELGAAFNARFDANAFISKKIAERQARLARFGKTPFIFEPHLKEGAGGFRDAHFATWCAKAAGLSLVVTSRDSDAVFTLEESKAWREALNVLADIRFGLHVLSKRSQNVLTYALRKPLAELLGIDEATLIARQRGAARTIARLTEIALSAILKTLFARQSLPLKSIDDTFYEIGSVLEAKNPSGNETFWKTFELMRHRTSMTRLGPEALRFVAQITPDALTDKQPFKALISDFEGVSAFLSFMHETGALTRVIPAFTRIEGFSQGEIFHTHTVDDHTLEVVNQIEAIANTEAADKENPLTLALGDIDEPATLIFAALMHDIGKADRGRHEITGEAIAREIAPAFGFDEAETEDIAFLVRNHLLMSLTAQAEDFTDPETLLAFAKTVATPARLNALYVLTVADIRATNTSIWNTWKGTLLASLYLETLASLSQAAPVTRQSLLGKRAKAARELVIQSGTPETAIAAFWATLPDAFFARLSAQTIAFITQSLATHKTPGVFTSAIEGTRALSVVVYERDADGLFLKMLAFLSSQSLSVLSAQIFTTEDGFALDTFILEDVRNREPTSVQAFLEEHFLAALETPVAPRTSRARFSRKADYFLLAPDVKIEPSDKSATTINVEIRAKDRLGLLYDFAKVLTQRGFALKSAKIMTMETVVEDRFEIKALDSCEEIDLKGLKAAILKAVA